MKRFQYGRLTDSVDGSIFFIIVLCLLLVTIYIVNSVSEVSDPISVSYNLPEELEDCKVFKVDGKGLPYIYITRCPETTTTDWETGSKTKTKHSSTVNNSKVTEPVKKEVVEINGVRYKKVD